MAKHIGESPAGVPIHWGSLNQAAGYRRRIRLRVFDDARIGFFNSGKYEGCCVLTDALRQVLRPLMITPPDCASALSIMHHIELREPDVDGKASAYFVKKDQNQPLTTAAIERLDEWLKGMYWAVAGETECIPNQRLSLPSVWHYVPIGSFLQVNQAINGLLIHELLREVKVRGISTFCDLYAGSGNFSLPLLASGLSGCAVEIDPWASRAARLAAVTQRLSEDAFDVGDAGAFASHAQSSGVSFDMVILDPPRAGIRRDILSMAAIAREYLVYCSCNLDTLARDLGKLHREGFDLESLAFYEMFPNTAHVEALAWMRAPRARR